MTPIEKKLKVKFSLSDADVARLLAAGLNTPAKIKKAVKDRTLPAGISGSEKTCLEGRWRK